MGTRALFHPPLGHDLAADPIAFPQIEQRKPRQITCAHADWIGRVDRSLTAKVAAILRPIVLHVDRLGDLLVERIEDAGAGRVLIDRAEHVEAPIVVVPEGAGRVAAARRSALAMPGVS